MPNSFLSLPRSAQASDNVWNLVMSTKEGGKTLKITRKYTDAGCEDEFDFEGTVAKIKFTRN